MGLGIRQYWHDGDICNHFLLGLPENVRAHIASLKPETFQDAYASLHNLKSLLPSKSKSNQTVSSPLELQVAALGDQLKEDRQKLSAIMNKLDTIQLGQNWQGPTQHIAGGTGRHKFSSDSTCQFCFKPGHIATDCRSLLRQMKTQYQPRQQNYMPNFPQQYTQYPTQHYMPQQMQPPQFMSQYRPQRYIQQHSTNPFTNRTCTYCGRRGHVESNCRTKLREMYMHQQGNC